MDDNDVTIIVGMEAEGADMTMWEAETVAAENARLTGGNNDRTQLHISNIHSLKEATNPPNDSKEELKRTKELILQSGSSRGFAGSPSPSKLNVKSSQAVYCVSNHIAKATFHSPSTSEQDSGAANSTSTSILPHSTSRSNPLMRHLPLRSFTSTGSITTPRANASTLISASTPCIPTSASISTTTIAAAPTPAVSLTPTLGIVHTRSSVSTSALSFFRNLKSTLKGKGKAKDRRRASGLTPDFLNLGGGTSTTSLPPTATTSSHKQSSIHLPLSTIFHGLRHGYKSGRSQPVGVSRMLPAPVIVTHQPSLSPSPVPPPASTIKRKRDIWRNLRSGISSRGILPNKATSGMSRTGLLDDEDASSVLDLGHIPLPSPLLYETCTIAPPNPNPKYTVTIHLTHPGQKVEYEMDNMTGHLLIMIYTPHSGFSTISGVVGGGSSRTTTSRYDDYDEDPYGYDTASHAGGIWIPQQFDWNGLRVRDWGSVSGKVVFQFPEYVRLGRGGEEWNEREVMPPEMSEEVMEVVLGEGDIDACVIKEEKWDAKGKGKGIAGPEAKTGGKRKGKGKEMTDKGGARGKPGSRYDLRPRS
ncbi:hypothetical protein EV426DRAFT_448178 [Tirmania nivea]|nr:hypothetical protein EV426DRAFT_448178 [Tirmania nivea]